MKTIATIDPKKARSVSSSVRSMFVPNRSSCVTPRIAERTPASIEPSSAVSNLGFDFGKISVTREASDCATCPLRSTPRRCPFGGACHTCPTSIQAKLAISQPGDPFEQEADRIADEVMRMPDPMKETLQRKCSNCDEDEDRLQLKEISPARASDIQNADVPPMVHEVLNSPGQPLDAETRAFFEPRFGHDFSRVRVHADPKAAESARAVNALAYTVGMNVVFGMGQDTLRAGAGRRLVAHELVHVVQDRKFLLGSSSNLRREILTVHSKGPDEQSTTGHAFVTLVDSMRRRRSFGFYPACTRCVGTVLCSDSELLRSIIGIGGTICDDAGHPWDDSISYQISTREHDAALAEANRQSANPPNWSLFNNCVHFVREIASKAGILIPDLPGIDEPQDLLEYIQRRSRGSSPCLNRAWHDFDICLQNASPMFCLARHQTRIAACINRGRK